MGGPSGHGQRNKAHKSGTKGPGARQKHRLGKEVLPGKHNVKAGATYAGGKMERVLAAKHQRDAKRQELLEKKRKGVSAPLVVAVLPLSHEVNVARVWSNLIAACSQTPTAAEDSKAEDDSIMIIEEDTGNTSTPVRMCTVSVSGRAKLRLTLLPPITQRNSPLAVVDLARAAEVVLLAVPGNEGSTAVDAEGAMALSILRAIGLPEIALAVQTAPASGSAAVSMKDRSAARKRAETAVSKLIAGEHKAYFVDRVADCAQLVRHLAERPTPALPHWRQQRPSLMVEHAEYVADPSGNSQAGQLALTGWVRGAGLSANQLITIPGAGDFQIDRIEGPVEQQQVLGAASTSGRGSKNQAGGDMEVSIQQPILLSKSDPESCEPLIRENTADDGGDNEQTWPSEAELKEASIFARRKARRRLPEGTSDYQAAWLLDDDYDEDDDDDEEDDGYGSDGMMADDAQPADMEDEALPDIQDQDEDGATDGMVMDDDEEEEEAGPMTRFERLQAEARARREAEGQDAQYPDEFDVPQGVAARVRLQKFRGLKSFRSSPWDAKEWLPQEYSKVFAFENIKRAHKRAREEVRRATEGLDPCAVEPGTWVRVILKEVSPQQAQTITARVNAVESCQAPLVCFGLMRHEAKMSVAHFSVNKVSSYTDPIANKEELLFVTGLRTFRANPVYSSDTPGDKHKMERWLRQGQPTVASVYSPICYPPLPLLAFKEDQLSDVPKLAATGSLKGCNPDRIVLKKIVLTGYPVRVHKRKCTVKYMFHDADDIRWFRPVELYTRAGRRGRITEPLGTHGAMKALFDGPVQQQDVVCMSLYKRVFPKWPKNNDLTFA